MTRKELALNKGFTEEQLAAFGVDNEGRGVKIPYHNADGTPYPRYQIRYTTEKSADKSVKPWGWSPGDQPCVPYGLNRPVPIATFVWIVEGPSDCWALWSAGHPAIGIPGSENIRGLRAEHVGEAKIVYVVREPDQGGASFPERVAACLRGHGYTGQVRAVPFTSEAKDPRALWVADREKFSENLRSLVRSGRCIQPPQIAVTEKKRETIVTMTMPEYLASRGESMDWLVEGLITAGGSMLIGAKKKVGKSMLALNLARCVARGETIIGRRVKQGHVLYISVDEGRETTDERTAILGFREDDPITWAIGRRIPAAWGEWLTEIAAKCKPALVIIDTFAKLAAIKEINSYSEWNKAFSTLYEALEDTKSACVLLAHNKKEGIGFDAVIGSTAVTANVDTIMVMTKDADKIVTVETEQRNGKDLEPCILKMDEETYELSVFDKHEEVRRMCEQAVLSVLSRATPMTTKQVVGAARKRAWDTRQALYGLIADGLVIGSGTGRPGDERTFRLSMMSAAPQKEGRSPACPESPGESGAVPGDGTRESPEAEAARLEHEFDLAFDVA